MTATAAPIVGQSVYMARTGRRPRITGIIWTGTAEVTTYALARVPAALVETDRGEMALVRLAGHADHGPLWTDALVVSSREWEREDGEMVGDTDPDIAARIDAYLAQHTDDDLRRERAIAERLRTGTLALLDD